jgi:hypothetical protein
VHVQQDQVEGALAPERRDNFVTEALIHGGQGRSGGLGYSEQSFYQFVTVGRGQFTPQSHEKVDLPSPAPCHRIATKQAALLKPSQAGRQRRKAVGFRRYPANENSHPNSQQELSN